MDVRTGKHSSAGLHQAPKDWPSWLQMYRELATTDDQISLLYRIPQTDWKTHSKESIPFLLNEAEGHVDIGGDGFFLTDEEIEDYRFSPEWRNRLADSRRAVAQKAFDVLVLNCFKDTRENHHSEPTWLWQMRTPEVLEAVMNFFRIDGEHRFINLNHRVADHRKETVEQFLLSLASYGWKRLENERGYDDKAGTKFFAGYRPAFMDILCALDQLTLLLKKSWGAGKLELTKLTELALAKEFHLSEAVWLSSKNFKPKTIEEAAYAGSQAGQVAILLRERLKLRKNLEDMADAWRQRQEADHALARLSSTTV